MVNKTLIIQIKHCLTDDFIYLGRLNCAFSLNYSIVLNFIAYMKNETFETKQANKDFFKNCFQLKGIFYFGNFQF